MVTDNRIRAAIETALEEAFRAGYAAGSASTSYEPSLALDEWRRTRIQMQTQLFLREQGEEEGTQT